MIAYLSSSIIVIWFLFFLLFLIIANHYKIFKLDLITFGFFTLINITYLFWRSTETLPELSLFNIWAWCFFLLEVFMILNGIFTAFLISMMNINVNNHSLELQKKEPSIDIFITTYNESAYIIEKTIVCAKNIHYNNINIWILDDGKRKDIELLCEQYQVHYLGRTERTHFKAGNLNNGLNYSANITNAEFILVLDADFLCHKDIATSLLSCIDQHNVAIVQAAQYFYNKDPVQHNFLASQAIVDDQRIFFEGVLPGLDKLDTALCCGCPALIKRTALMNVGGFPTDTVTEDVNLSYRFFQNGYITRYTQKIVAYGMSPETLNEYIKQRCRWATGTLQQLFSQQSSFRFNKQSLLQRVEFISCVLHWFSYPFRIMCLLAPILALLFSVTTFSIQDDQVYLYVPIIIMTSMIFLASKNRGKMLILMTDVINFVIAIPLVFAVLKGLLKKGSPTFSVTEKNIKIKNAIINYHLATPLIVLISLNLIGMLLNHHYSYQVSLGSYTHLSFVWASINTLFLLTGLFMIIDLPRLYHKWTLSNPNINIITDTKIKIEAQVDGISVEDCDVFIAKDTLKENDSIEIELTGFCNVKGVVTSVKPNDQSSSSHSQYKTQIHFTDPKSFRLKNILGYVFSNGNISLMTQNNYWYLFKRLIRRLFM
ncbi:glycosyltransferase [uncultured Shewanella sp.]|uniref:glycosyltransferase n=1 Tax=uncultured Shewanella sp. TaxID=173975 RepID=UPI002624F308|nr:glycosyltransferase [uncultured Shewanella sp.]